MSRVFFVLIFDYYKEGVSTTTKLFLLDAAKSNENGNEIKDEVLIYSDWNYSPSEIKDMFDHPPTEFGKLVRKLGPRENRNLSKYDAFFYVVLTRNKNNRAVYVGKIIDWRKTGVTIGEFNLKIYRRAMLINIGLASVFAIIMFFILKLVISPLETLKLWATKLSKEPVQSANPKALKFRYREFSEIADVIYGSVLREKESIDREKEFLTYMSHELRTPLALMKNNSERLKKLIVKDTIQQHRAIARIEDATDTTTSLVETLLWLGADHERKVILEPVNLSNIVTNKINETDYLLKDKNIKIDFSTNESVLDLPLVPTEIVVVNLIANALQHAQSGKITISQLGNTLTVTNYSSVTQNFSSRGFGLGLNLVGKICKTYGWSIKKIETANKYESTVIFT